MRWLVVVMVMGCGGAAVDGADAGAASDAGADDSHRAGLCETCSLGENQIFCKDGLMCKPSSLVCRPLESAGMFAICEADCARLCGIDGRCTPAEAKCVVATDADCRKSAACSQEGKCTEVDGACAAVNSQDCKNSFLCSIGECTARDGVCVAGSAADCAEQCASRGWCAPAVNPNGPFPCVATSDADCAGSMVCRSDGACSFNGTGCWAASDADCQQSDGCHAFLRCTRTTAGACVN